MSSAVSKKCFKNEMRLRLKCVIVVTVAFRVADKKITTRRERDW